MTPAQQLLDSFHTPLDIYESVQRTFRATLPCLRDRARMLQGGVFPWVAHRNGDLSCYWLKSGARMNTRVTLPRKVLP